MNKMSLLIRVYKSTFSILWANSADNNLMIFSSVCSWSASENGHSALTVRNIDNFGHTDRYRQDLI